MESRDSHIEIFIVGTETVPGKYYQGEDANYKGAGERPLIGGIASGTGAEGKDIPIVDANKDGEVVYGRLVNNDAVQETPIPQDKKPTLAPISDHFLHQQ